eukprot:TRINITY_DN328_c0_g1_i2.p1 TRINITY_DN328_c0_g1~~TRINITY_DN328_c0_g1_i2.p1  ORF type:complete len:223 (+),score=38.45 TRINITY_DN328_c0_g1_i2:83-751(+)
MDLESLILPLISLPTVLIPRAIDFEEGDRKTYLIAFWSIAQVLNLILCYLLRRKILLANEQRIVSVPSTNVFAGGKNQKKEKQFLSIRDYDIKEWQKSVIEVVAVILVTVFAIVKYNAITPLLLSIVFMPYRIFKSKLFRIHFLNHTGDDLIRPFKNPPNPLFKMFKEMKQELGMSESKGRKKKPKKPTDSQKAALRAAQGASNSSPKQAVSQKKKTPNKRK